MARSGAARTWSSETSPPRRRLVSEIAYLKIGEGWLYLATVIDLATRLVAGRLFVDTETPVTSSGSELAVLPYRYTV